MNVNKRGSTTPGSRASFTPGTSTPARAAPKPLTSVVEADVAKSALPLSMSNDSSSTPRVSKSPTGVSLADAAHEAAGAVTEPPLFSPLSRLADELESPAPSTPRSRSDSVVLEDQLQDSDDFVIMDEAQAKHIARMCEWAFGIELSTDVVLADANVTALAKRVLGASNLIDGSSGNVSALNSPHVE